jgi:hypothetical protein
MKNVNILTFLLLLFIVGCKSNNGSKTEIIQKHRDKIINVSDKIVDIKPEILFGNSLLYIIDDILIVNEVAPKGEKGIHLFNKNTFKYITSTGIIGKGPGEIIVPGRIGIDYKNRILWVPDHGKKVMFKFPLDSILKNNAYKPTIKIDLRGDLFIERYGFLNDSIILGKAVQPTSNSTFVMKMCKFNLYRNAIEKYGYEHPEAVEKKSNSQFAISVKNNCYVNCYSRCDLMTICDLDGNLKCNVYGADGFNNKDNKNSYFFGVDVMGKNIIASYIGDIGLITDGNRPRGNTPSKFLVFDINGNYKETIETGHKFTYYCVDEENKRIIVYFDSRSEPLGYFNVNLD